MTFLKGTAIALCTTLNHGLGALLYCMRNSGGPAYMYLLYQAD
jgi:hypothetical protein